ncbi:MAG: hypothetical protein HY903_20145 [Deltaproteobacteria bacterium]|nr:hypothetical protein [Deltaproteobacteria bacterium]
MPEVSAPQPTTPPSAAPQVGAPQETATTFEVPALEIHGYANWGVGYSDHGHYLIASPHGEFGHMQLALTFAAMPTERLTIFVQPFIGMAPFFGGQHEGWEAEVDYAFVRYALSDLLRVQIGKSRQPFGLYSEIFEVGTVRPFLLLAQSLYGPVGIMTEGYFGAGINGAAYSDSGWGVEYDLYGGGLDLPLDTAVAEAGEMLAAAAMSMNGEAGAHREDAEVLNSVVGGRLSLRFPVEGLMLGAAGYLGQHLEDDERHAVYGGQAQYQAHGVTARCEYYRVRSSQPSQAGAAELAYRAVDPLEIAVRYEASRLDLPEGQNQLMPRSVREHNEASVGLALWLSPEAVIKASGHYVRGNRLAHGTAEDLVSKIETGETRPITKMLLFGVSFSF